MSILEVHHIEKHFGATRVLEDQLFPGGGSGSGHHRFLRLGKDHPAAVPQLSGDA